MLLGYEEGIGEGQGLYSSLINHQSPEYKAVARSLARSLPHPSQSSTMVSSCSTLRGSFSTTSPVRRWTTVWFNSRPTLRLPPSVEAPASCCGICCCRCSSASSVSRRFRTIAHSTGRRFGRPRERCIYFVAICWASEASVELGWINFMKGLGIGVTLRNRESGRGGLWESERRQARVC